MYFFNSVKLHGSKENRNPNSQKDYHTHFEIKMTSALDLNSGLLASNVLSRQQSIVYDKFCHCKMYDQISWCIR